MQLHSHPTHRPVTLAWLDADEAIVLRWGGRATVARPGPTIQRLRSGVPAHRRATGHLRHDPTFRSGGGGEPDDRAERRRERLLEQYLHAVAARLPPDDRVVLAGPGPTHERLAAELRAADLHHGRERPVEAVTSGPRTERQLVAWLRELAGAAPERQLPAAAGSRG